MKLSEHDTALFFRLQSAILAYVNKKLNIIPGCQKPEEILKLTIEDKTKVRSALWENEHLILSFIDENPFGIVDEELGIVESWRYHIKGRFLLVKYLKDYAVFLDQNANIPYGVLALGREFETIFGTQLPIVVETVLLPFKDQITYDGLIAPYGITFGSGARKNIHDSCQQAKAERGIVTRLPFSAEPKEPSNEEMLKFYLKNQGNREMYRDEIWELTRNNPKMLTAYHQIMGKNHARHYGKEFRKMGLKQGWFAILQGLIVASGVTRDEAEKTAKKLVPPEKMDWIHFLHLNK